MATIKDWLNAPKIPEIKLTRPEEMLANKNHATERPTSLIIEAMVRFPTVPPLAPYHPAMAKRIEMEKLGRFIDQMFITDWNLHRRFSESAREREQTKRIEDRRTVENDTADEHAFNVVQRDLDRRIFFFKRALDNMLQQRQVNSTERQEMLALFEELRKLTVERFEKYTVATRKLIKQGQKDHEAYWEFRQDRLWSGTETGGVSKLKKYGNKIEEVTGDIDRKEKARITEEHWDWRRDNVYVALPNGGMAHSSGGNGKAPETMAAEVHAPLIAERLSHFQNWRASSSYVTTPNQSLRHMKNQGLQPEGAIAAINQPKKEQVTEAHLEHFKWKMAGPTPNGGFAPMYNSGNKPEAVTAAIWWPARQEVTNALNQWQQNYLFKPTSNGGWQILEAVGKSVEHTAAMIDLPKKEKATEEHQHWRQNNLWHETPNKGYARLAGVGSPLEKISFEFFEPKKIALTEYHEQRSLNNLYVETPNQGWRKLTSVGADQEKVAGDVNTIHNAEVGEFFDDRARNNLFVPTGNDGVGRLPNIGQTIEKAAHDALAPNKDISPTNVKQFVHNQADTSVDRGQGSPQGSNGRSAEEAAASSASQSPAGNRNSFLEFKKNLAALEQATSAFSAHTGVTPQSDSGPSKHQVSAAPGGASSKKAG